MTMQALKQAGLFVGDRLTPADPSNADGHFEDTETVALHDRWLSQNNSNWCHIGDLPVVDDQLASTSISTIARRLGAQNPVWGVKDPRACLFLSYWFDNLQEPGGIFSYRHFASCYESLQRRHGNDLLLNPQTDNQSFALYAEPSLALHSWLAYNKSILAQIKRTPDRCLLVSQHALVSGFPLVKEVNRQFSTCFNDDADLRIDHSKVANRESVHLPNCPQQLVDELHSVWDELQSASVAATQEQPDLTWGPVNSDVVPDCSESAHHSVVKAIENLLPLWDKLSIVKESVQTSDIATALSLQTNRHTQEQPVEQLPKQPQSSNTADKADVSNPDYGSIDFSCRQSVNAALHGIEDLAKQQKLLESGLTEQPDNSFLHGLLGKCLFNRKMWASAIVHLVRAAELGSDDPSVFFHAALWHIEHVNKYEAKRFIRLALGLRRNADHLCLLITLHSDDRTFDEAQRLALLGYEWFPGDERFVLLHADALIGDSRITDAISWLNDNDGSRNSSAIARKLYGLYYSSGDTQRASELNLETQRRVLRQQANYRSRATHILQSLKSDYAQDALSGIWCDTLRKLLPVSKTEPIVSVPDLPRVAMSILVRDEVDIIESNIRFHAAAGIEHFIVTDNASADGTRELLAMLRTEFSIDIIDEPSHTIDQDLWVTRMARQLQHDHQGRFDWIIHNDADEFWVPECNSIPAAIRSALSIEADSGINTGVLCCKRLNMLTAQADVQFDDYAFHDNVHAVIQNVPLLEGEQPWSDDNSNCVARLVMDKVLTRTQGLSSVEYGNHGAEHKMNKSKCHSITVLHFPVRTFAQFERKVINYGESLARNTRFSAGSSLHLRHWYKRYLDGMLHEDYDQMVFDANRLQNLLDSGHVRLDSRISDFFKTVTLGTSHVAFDMAA